MEVHFLLHFLPLCGDHDVVVNPFKPEFTLVIFIHYKPRFMVDEGDLNLVASEKKIIIIYYYLLLKAFHENFRSKILRF